MTTSFLGLLPIVLVFPVTGSATGLAVGAEKEVAILSLSPADVAVAVLLGHARNHLLTKSARLSHYTYTTRVLLRQA